MIIKFKVKEFDKYMCMYQNIWHKKAGETLVINENTQIEVEAYRIVVSDAGMSLRYGVVYNKTDEESYDDEDEWEISYDLFVVYDREEKDWEKWICTQGNDFEWAIKGYMEEKQGLKDVDVSELDCYVDTSEFIEGEAEAERLAALDIEYYNENWKEEFEGDDD